MLFLCADKEAISMNIEHLKALHQDVVKLSDGNKKSGCVIADTAALC